MVSVVIQYNGKENEPYAAAQKQLLAEWHPKGLVLLQIDEASGQIEEIEMLQIDWQNDWEDDSDLLTAQSNLIHRTDIPLTFISAGTRATLTPLSLWDANRAEQEYFFWQGNMQSQKQFTHPIAHQIMVMWEIPDFVWEYFTSKFSVVTSRHIYHYVLAGGNHHPNHIRLTAVGDVAYTSVYNNGRLQNAQPISLAVVDNFVYHLLDRCRLHQLDAATTPLHIGGRIAKDGNLMAHIGRFFGNIVWEGQSSPALNEIPSHFFNYLTNILADQTVT